MFEYFGSILPESLKNEYVDMSGDVRNIFYIVIILTIILVLLIYVLVFLGAVKLKKFIFKRIKKKKGNSITVQFLERAITLAIVVIFVIVPLAGKTFARSLLGSTAVIAAVVGLAANDVIKNMFAGLEISLYKPFDVGSRIMLDDGRAGIVEEMNLRHVVIKLLDTTTLVVPNSKANSAIVTNFSYVESVPRSMELRFPIAYDSDIDLAKQVIRQTICNCPMTLNEDKYDEEDPGSRSVYFLGLKDSSLTMAATVYYPFKYRTEVVMDEIYTSVFKALKENGIEVPYNYLNVTLKEGDKHD